MDTSRRVAMPTDANGTHDYRVLVLAPTSRDAKVSRELLEHANIFAASYSDALAVATELETGVGALLLTDSAFADPHFDRLLAVLSRQPPWSDVPVVLLCRAVPSTRMAGRILESLRNVTLLERPTSARTLLSSVQAALRARARQYQLREQIEALRASEAALRDADQRKDVFLATLAHELRNPLAPIRHAAHILTSPSLAPNQLQWVQAVIQRQAAHMALLLDDLLDIARITRGKLELKWMQVRLSEIVEAAVEAARPLLDGKNHQLTITLPSEELMLDADPLRLSQILTNLLTNAAKYTDPAGHISLVGTIQNDGTLSLSVKDDGIGITAEALARIFQMFSQIDGTSARTEGGLGIGLALVQGLVVLHGGTIEASSDGAGQGSTFVVHLPLAKAAKTEMHATIPATQQPAKVDSRTLASMDNKDTADTADTAEMARNQGRQ